MSTVILQAHPLASLFPDMVIADAADLARDIKAHGQREPIVLFHGQILDGRHRYAACTKLGIKPKTVEFTGTDDEARALVFSLNLHRRHLQHHEKMGIVMDLLLSDPTRSDRMIADRIGVSPSTVAKARAEAVAAGMVSTVDTITGKDGVVQPAKKSKASKPTVVTPDPIKSVGVIGDCDLPPHDPSKLRKKLLPPSDGLMYSQMAIAQLWRITDDDVELDAALDAVLAYVAGRRVPR